MKIDSLYKFIPAGLSVDEYHRLREVKAEKIVRILRSYILDLDKKSLLDVGCHEGTITYCLGQSFASATGMDVDDKIIEIARKLNGENIEFVSYDGEKFPFDDSQFDVLIANHVIYYVNNTPQFLKEVKRVLRPGGVCYLSAINVAYVRSPLLFPRVLWVPITRRILKSADDVGHPSSYNQYMNMFRQFHVVDFSLELLKNPREFATEIDGWQKVVLLFLGKLPDNILIKLQKLLPTYIYLLINSDSPESRSSA